MPPLSAATSRRAALARARAPILFLDLDGTLAPIVERPARARVPDRTRRVLRRLRHSGARVVLVSGRSVPGVVRALGTPVDAILGDHGGRALFGGRVRPWLVIDPAPLVRAVAAVAKRIEEWPGVTLEQKERSLAIHLRLTPTASRRVVPELSRMLRRLGLRVLLGHRVLDVQLPGIDKGRAVRRWLLADPGDQLLYAGDDTTDEDAFRALRGRALTIAVGRRPDGAEFRTRSPASFCRWLESLALERERWRRA